MSEGEHGASQMSTCKTQIEGEPCAYASRRRKWTKDENF